jgi:hypothetical protein
MFRTPVIAAFALLAAGPSPPRSAEPATAAAPRQAYAAIEQVGWTYRDGSVQGGPADQLRFFVDRRGHFDWTVGPQDAVDVRAIVVSIERAPPGDELSFSLAREAGVMACSGRAEQGGRASGICRFDPNQGFAASLARHGIAPRDSDEIVGLTLADARLATVDGLEASGFRFDDAGQLIAVSALDVTPAYAGELRGAGLKIDKLGDLIAAKALKIDSGWLGEMARAGYPDLPVGRAIQMRALGVTPDYAMKMDRVLRAVHEIE